MKYIKEIIPEPVVTEHEVVLTTKELRLIRTVLGKLGGRTHKHNIALGLSDTESVTATILHSDLFDLEHERGIG